MVAGAEMLANFLIMIGTAGVIANVAAGIVLMSETALMIAIPFFILLIAGWLKS